MTTAEKISVMQAYEDGKPIQRCRLSDGAPCDEWVDVVGGPTWNWHFYAYRVKPEPKYRPYENAEEMIVDFKKRFAVKNPPHTMPLIWIEDKAYCKKHLINKFYSELVLASQTIVSMPALLNDFVYLDGSPCGKLVEE